MTTHQENFNVVSTQTLSSEDVITNELIQDQASVNLIEEIETVISSMVQDQKILVGHSEAGNLWKFKYGSVEVFVQLTGQTDDDTLNVWSFVLQLPAKNEPQLMRQLLQMNWLSTLEARFAIVDDYVVVVSTRTVADLNPGEISRVITIVATIADDHDDALQAEFGNS